MGAGTMSAAELAPYLAGPGSAVVCLLLVGVGGYRFAVAYLVPVLEATVAGHMAELERANARHEAAVTAHLSHISGMGERYDRLAAQHADEHGGADELMLHQGHERGASRDDARLVAGGRERGDGGVDAVRLDVLERAQDHREPAPRAASSAR